MELAPTARPRPSGRTDGPAPDGFGWICEEQTEEGEIQAAAKAAEKTKSDWVRETPLEAATRKREQEPPRPSFWGNTGFGPQGRPALPKLIPLAEQDRENRQFILDCVCAIDPEEGERLTERLKEGASR